MTFIHDKTPEGRRKLKEGPKAQSAYLDDLMTEWVDHHASKDPEPEDFPPDMPENERQRWRLHEERAQRELEEKGFWDSPVPDAIVVETEEGSITLAEVELARRGDMLMRRAAWEMNALGRVREATLEEVEAVALSLGIPFEEILQPPVSEE